MEKSMNTFLHEGVFVFCICGINTTTTNYKYYKVNSEAFYIEYRHTILKFLTGI